MINSNKKKVTVDFRWTTESQDGNTGYGVFIKHHHTDEYGPTISVSETDLGIWVKMKLSELLLTRIPSLSFPVSSITELVVWTIPEDISPKNESMTA